MRQKQQTTSKNTLNRVLGRVCTISLLLMLTACASTTPEGDVADPFESVNRPIFEFNETVDKYIVKPVAETYQYTPSVVRSGVTNFFNNISDVITVVNDILQLKIEQGIKDSMRITFNSSFGLLGLVDVATDWGLPRNNERFADTLGYWGVDSGPYLVLPFLGPSSLRDAPALVADSYAYPLTYLHPVDHRNSLQGFKLINDRANLLSASKLKDEVALDPYSFTRNSYYQWRQNRIYDGNPPEQYQQNFNADDLE